MIRNLSIATISATIIAASASADMTGFAYQNGYAWSGSTFGGSTSGYVVDLYLEFDSMDDVLLNVYNYNQVGGSDSYYQGLTAAGWAPNLQSGPFETDDALEFDSFIAIGDTGPTNGNPDQMAGNGVSVDPNFGGNTAGAPGTNAGWYNGNPNNTIGMAQQTVHTANGIGVFIGRFSVENSNGFSLEGSSGQATFNQGPGTDGLQESFVVVPAPGALALLGVAGLAGRRRRK